MTRKQLDTMREVRLWIGQLVVPGLLTGASLMAIPEVRNAVSQKAWEIKCSIQEKKKAIKEKWRKSP